MSSDWSLARWNRAAAAGGMSMLRKLYCRTIGMRGAANTRIADAPSDVSGRPLRRIALRSRKYTRQHRNLTQNAPPLLGEKRRGVIAFVLFYFCCVKESGNSSV